jgi:ornithine cyclodeaminase/alanine dehydrogenase-like protein (mu-crystallin family)
VRVLTEAEVRKHLDPTALISALESAFRDRYTELVIPSRVHMDLAQGVVFLLMPSYDRSNRALGIKFVTVKQKPADCDERVQATCLLLDPATGSPRLVMPANHLTDVRTAVTSAIATGFLARDDVKVLGVFGTGRQARAHLRVLPLIRRFERALVCGRDRDRTRSFAGEMSAELNLTVEACDADHCAATSDVLCTCTTSALPLFDGKLLRAGTHLNLVGAFQSHAREVDSITVKRAIVVVDTYDGALAEAGDILIPLHEGAIHRDHIQMDLHELTKSKPLLRPGSGGITLFKSVGCALEDLVAAEQIERSLPPP